MHYSALAPDCVGTETSDGEETGRRLHWQRLHHTVPHPFMASGPGRRHSGHLQPQPGNAEDAAALARSLRVGEATPFRSIEEMVADPAIDCVWICGPNFARVENMERIVHARAKGAELVGVACEKPLARNAAEARQMVSLVEQAGVLHGYLENQLFSPASNVARTSSGRAGPGPRAALSRPGRRGTRRTAHAVVLAG